MESKSVLKRVLNKLKLYKLLGLLYIEILSLSNGMKLHIETTNGEKSLSLYNKKKIIKVSERHFMYIPDLIREFDTYFSSVLPAQEGDFIFVDFTQPAVQTLSKSHTSFFFTSLPESEEVIEFYLQKGQLKLGDVVLDLGAYCGATAYFFSKAVGEKGTVIAVEPDPQNFAALIKNIHDNDLVNVKPINKGIWSDKRTIKFLSENNLGSSIVGVNGREENSITIETMTMQDIIFENQLSKIDFIKMDIEGSELEALYSSEEVFTRFRPKIIIEPHYINGILCSEEIYKFFEKLNYSCERIQQGSAKLPLLFAKSNLY